MMLKNQMKKEIKTSQVLQTDASKSRVISSLIWKFLERGGTQGVQFVVQIVLARLLVPSDYGILAILMVFIEFANIFVQSGFNTALIQKQNADFIDFSTVFWISLIISTIFYILIFISSTFIARFYKNDTLSAELRVLSIILFFCSLNSIQNALVSKTMQFKRLFFSSLGGTVVSGIFGICFAKLGLGVWSLIIQQLTNNFIISAILWNTVKWRPIFKIDIKRAKSLFSFGEKLFSSSLLAATIRHTYSIVIGRLFSSAELGCFNRGEQFPAVIMSNIDSSIQGVMLPTLSSKINEEGNFKRILRRTINTTIYITAPCMLGLASVAKNTVILLLTEKWISCVPFLQLACIDFLFYPIQSSAFTAINAIGKSGTTLKLETIKQIIIILALIITLRFGLISIAIGRIISSIIATVINCIFLKKLFKYGYSEQIKDTFPAILLSVVMAGIIYPISLIKIPSILIVCIQIISGIFLYLFFSKLFKLESFTYLVQTLKEFKIKNQQ